jgi:carbamate kinase
MEMRVADTTEVSIVAMGGNSLIDPKLAPTVAHQFEMAARAVGPIADLIVAGHRLVITHGNGPQVGFMALRSELSKEQLHEVPLDSIVANTQGSLGYMIQRALGEEFRRRKFKHEVVSIVTEVEVDPNDQAFGHPTKPIGRFYTESESQTLQRERGWDMVQVRHRGWRRVVASPAPVKIVQLPTIRRLIDQGVTVVCCGGGGIPVVRDTDGSIRGMEAVIDKDRVSALLGVRVAAKRLFLTTGTDAVYRNFAEPNQERIDRMTVAMARTMQAEDQFPAGSMGPKVEAAIRFVMNGSGSSVICKPEDLVNAFDGVAGTRVVEA